MLRKCSLVTFSVVSLVTFLVWFSIQTSKMMTFLSPIVCSLATSRSWP
ncbi:hypothetical protein [Lactobacillus equicursoris]|nr:hypothetical protein [Lactobacillus equicursoris]